jgi:hypothetical protein
MWHALANTTISNFTKVRSPIPKLIHADRRTNRQGKANRSSFATFIPNAPEISQRNKYPRFVGGSKLRPPYSNCLRPCIPFLFYGVFHYTSEPKQFLAASARTANSRPKTIQKLPNRLAPFQNYRNTHTHSPGGASHQPSLGPQPGVFKIDLPNRHACFLPPLPRSGPRGWWAHFLPHFIC